MRRSVRDMFYFIFFLAAPFYAFQTFPDKAQLFSRFFPFVLTLSAVIDMSDP